MRIDSIEQVLDAATSFVEVTEVDPERGRIALKLVAKQEDGGEVTPEELGARYKVAFPTASAAAAAARRRPGRPRRQSGGRGGRDRDRGPRQ